MSKQELHDALSDASAAIGRAMVAEGTVVDAPPPRLAPRGYFLKRGAAEDPALSLPLLDKYAHLAGIFYEVPWGWLEGGGGYSFGKLESLLGELERRGKYLHLWLQWKAFRSDLATACVAPDLQNYMSNDTASKDVWSARIHEWPTLARLLGLIRALREAFDGHPALAYVDGSESAPGNQLLDAAGTERGLRAIYSAMAEFERATPLSPVNWWKTAAALEQYAASLGMGHGSGDCEDVPGNAPALVGDRVHVAQFSGDSFKAHGTVDAIHQWCTARKVIAASLLTFMPRPNDVEALCQWSAAHPL